MTFKDKYHSEETKRKISNALNGHVAWNKGIPCSEKQRQKQHLIMKDRPSKLKGIPKSKEHKLKLSLALIGRPSFMKGKHLSEETKRKISLANNGKHPSQETRLKMSLAGKDRKHTEESKKKMSLIHKGKIFSEEHKKHLSETHIGKNTWSKGKPMSEEQKRKIGLANTGRLAGAKNSQWLGGLSFEPYTPEFNKQMKLRIRSRDKFTCQECKQTEEQLGYDLRIHHIDYNKKNNNPENLISLCQSCHSQTNFDRTDWTNYFKDLRGDI